MKNVHVASHENRTHAPVHDSLPLSTIPLHYLFQTLLPLVQKTVSKIRPRYDNLEYNTIRHDIRLGANYRPQQRMKNKLNR